MSNQGRKVIIVALIVFLAGFAWFATRERSKKLTSNQKMLPRAEVVTMTAAEYQADTKQIRERVALARETRAAEVTKKNQEVAKARELQALKESLPFRSAKIVKTTAEHTMFNVSMENIDNCSYGDMDAIIGDMKASDKNRVLFSIESVVAGDPSFSPIVMQLSKEDIVNGFLKQIKIPPVKNKAVQLGVYLCRDSEGKNSCNGKSVVDIKEVIEKHYFKKNGSDAGDSIYYFQYLLVTPEAVSYLESPLISDKDYSNSKKYLDEVGIVSEAGNHRVFDRTKQLNRSIKSVPPEINSKSQSVVIRLPKRNLEKCKSK